MYGSETAGYDEFAIYIHTPIAYFITVRNIFLCILYIPILQLFLVAPLHVVMYNINNGRNLRTGGTHMNNTIQYKGYLGSVEFSEEDGIFYGKVMGIRSLISYEGENAKDLLNDFHGAIDDYLETCKAEGKEPEVAYKGSFNIRISPELHKRLIIYTTAHQMSLNRYIEETLENSPAAL